MRSEEAPDYQDFKKVIEADDIIFNDIQHYKDIIKKARQYGMETFYYDYKQRLSLLNKLHFLYEKYKKYIDEFEKEVEDLYINEIQLEPGKANCNRRIQGAFDSFSCTWCLHYKNCNKEKHNKILK